MKIITSQSPDDALSLGLAHLEANGTVGQSRNGPVVVSPTPVVTVNIRPRQRVMFSSLRDANPFFHLFESIWMLVGRNDVEFPAMYAKQLELYSDDGATLNGAYGHRWRKHFQYDQLEVIIEELKSNPQSRRCVLAMWDGERDLVAAQLGSKDVPCNTHIYFNAQPGDNGPLDMTVCCRSNDAVWGAHGANVVHFSFLLEYVAQCVGRPVGYMYQYSNNYHIYSERPDVQRLMGGAFEPDLAYAPGGGRNRVMVNEARLMVTRAKNADERSTWREEANYLLECALNESLVHVRWASLSDPFLSIVVGPLMLAHQYYRTGQHKLALETAMKVLDSGAAEDWAIACIEWMRRRKNWTGA